MPFGIEDPLKYTSKRTTFVIYPKEVGKCCLCGKAPRALCPVHLNSANGLLCTFSCQTCYKHHRNNPSIDYESIMMGVKGSTETKKPLMIPNSFKATLPVGLGSKPVAPKSPEILALISELRTMVNLKLDRLSSLVIGTTNEASELEIPVEASEHQEASVHVPIELPRERRSKHKCVVLSEEDDDLEFGMTDEQRAMMDEAVKQAEVRAGTVIEAPSES